MNPLRRVWRTLPEPVRTPLRQARHGETTVQKDAGRMARAATARAGRARGIGATLIGPVHRPRRAEVVDRYDAWAELRGLVAGLATVLADNDVEFAVPPVSGARTALVVVAAEEAGRVRQALAGSAGTANWWVADESAGAIRNIRPIAEASASDGEATALLCFRYLVSPSGVLLNDETWHVRLEFWTTIKRADVPRPDGETFEQGTRVARVPNTTVAYLQPDEWRAAQELPSRWLDWPPNVLDVDEPIDIVYTWVDGADPSWRERKAHAQGRLATGEYNPDSLAANRFISRDELKYSLRSVEMYASWVRHVWVVTDQQVPDWLWTDHPGLTVVDHREIFSDPAALPVFNSHAIESQLHHIEGLAERYLYLNDDMFFGRPVTPETFFFGNGISKFFPSTAVLDVTPRSVRDLAVASAGKRNRELIERDFGRTLTNKLRHTPQPQTKTLLMEMEERYPDLFDALLRSRFRHPDDYAIPSALSQWYAFATGRAVSGGISYGYQDIAAPNAELILAKWLRQRRFECFCLNDTAVDPASADRRDRAVTHFLGTYFPVESTYEKRKPA